ncbi:VCBS repeat-containing protein [Streptomyces sp. NBC_00250]|uniref:VCBS repeat-containing protein n=1 Tax=Streptomyces sp. NBC_00250 TaxID=2903641 RepID=UPI002E2ACE88|nr:VCBS repeat-containing protein [Streptomyces sp. NBC_00250]
MKHPASAGRRLTAAVAVALAVTAGGLTAPALAAAPAPVTSPAADEQPAFSVPAGTTVLSSGPSGFLTFREEGTALAYVWVRNDGTPTRLSGQWAGSEGTDIAVRREGTKHTYVDMTTGKEVVSYDTAQLGGTHTVVRYQGTSLVTRKYVSGSSGQELHVISKDAEGRTVDRKVSGMPLFATQKKTESDGPDTLLYRYDHSTGGVPQQDLAVVDVPSAKVVATYDTLGTSDLLSMGASETRVAWFEWSNYNNPVLAVARRDGTEVTRTRPLSGFASSSFLSVQIIGDWAVHTLQGGGAATVTDPLHQVTARSLTTGETVPLLAHASRLVESPDGSLITSGGTLDQGEGVYRIAPGENGAHPTVSLLATTGVATELTVAKETLPPTGTFDLDRAGGKLTAGWTLNRKNARVTLKLVHVATGRSVTVVPPYTVPATTDFPLVWDGLFAAKFPAYNGAYTWTMTAAPANGIGPAVERSGSFTLTRAARLHDVDDNGSADVLNRSASGTLSSYDLGQLLRREPGAAMDANRIGSGWNAYDRMTATGNLGGTPAADLVARDRTGVLWFYEGKGKNFAPRKRIGGGWNTYDKLTGGSDVTGDGRVDLLAADKTGVLWLHPGKGDGTFAPRKKIGGGWGGYNLLSATGNLAGAGAGDLVARDRAGVLWLYLGKGDGTFAARTRIGGGWGLFDDLVGVGDADGDGRNDLAAFGAGGGTNPGLLLYGGTGQWAKPFSPHLLAEVGYDWLNDLY